jgi:hypothetical protein
MQARGEAHGKQADCELHHMTFEYAARSRAWRR